MNHPAASATSEQMKAEPHRAATSLERQCCLRWVNRLLDEQPEVERTHFWHTPRASLHGRTPLQALEHGELRRLQEAAEAFANA